MLLQDCATSPRAADEGRGFEPISGGPALNFPSCHYHSNCRPTQAPAPGYINQQRRWQWTFVNKRKKAGNKQNGRRQVEEERKWLEVDVRLEAGGRRRALIPRHRSRPLHWIVLPRTKYFHWGVHTVTCTDMLLCLNSDTWSILVYTCTVVLAYWTVEVYLLPTNCSTMRKSTHCLWTWGCSRTLQQSTRFDMQCAAALCVPYPTSTLCPKDPPRAIGGHVRWHTLPRLSTVHWWADATSHCTHFIPQQGRELPDHQLFHAYSKIRPRVTLIPTFQSQNGADVT